MKFLRLIGSKPNFDYLTRMKIAMNFAALRDALIARKAEVAAEIRNYPGPIPGCDAQFNHLLETRRILAQELQRIETVTDENVSVADFVNQSPSARELPDILALP